MNGLPETTFRNASQLLEENDQGSEACSECGQSVRTGSGRFVNRIIDLNNYRTRREMGKPYPDGDYLCAECDMALDVQTENVLQFPVRREKTMNCTLCGEHILATTSIAWNRGDYHPDCIGEAVAQYRAAQDRINQGLSSSDYEAFEDPEPFEDEYAGYEEDDLDCLIDRFDEMPEVSDEVLNQIPVTAPNGRREVHVSDVIASVTNQFVAERSNGTVGSVGTLISGMTTTLINREALRHLPVPETTDTFKPIPHFELVDNIMKSLSYRRLEVVREEYAVSFDGMKMFGLIELNVEYSGVRFAIGLRNSNDKSMRVGLVAGYRVMVCENKMLTGDFQPMLAKHSKNFNLIDGLSVAVDRIQRNIGRVEQHIGVKKQKMLSDESAKSLIYEAFLNRKIPMSLMRLVHREFFIEPQYAAFADKSLWSLENCFTNAFKKLKPVQQFEACSKLGKLITPLVLN